MIKKKGISINSLLLVVSGIMIVLISLFTYLYILRGVYGQFEFSDDLASLPFGSVFKSSDEIKIAILYSDNTESKLLPPGSTWMSDNVETWKKFLTSYKLNYTVLHDSDIERGRHYTYNFLLLPGCKALSDQQVNAIKRFIDKGGSVFATAGTASFSNDGKWRGWEFFSEVFGMRFFKEIHKEEITRNLIMRGGFPLTSGVPTGFPLKVATYDMPIMMQVLEPRTTQLSYWFNYRLDTMLVREGLQKTAGIAYGTYGAGRFVWFGFELNSIVGTNEDFIYFDKLVHNSVDWLLYRPISNVQDFPGEYRSAALITPVISENIENAANILPILSSKGVKPCFFVDPVTAETKPQLLKQLAQQGDLGAIVDVGYLSSVTDTMNKLFDLDAQFGALKSASDKISAIAGKEVLAVTPKYGIYDDRTVSAAARAGYKYLFTDSLSDRSVPKIVIKGEKPILIISKTIRDDFEIIRDLGLTQPEFQVYTYYEDIEKMIFEGGLFLFKPHASLQCLPENASVIGSVIDSLRSRKVWVTSLTSLYNWGAQRNKLEMRVEPRSATRLALTVSNSGKQLIQNFSVDVDLQIAIKKVFISSEIIGTEMPKYQYNPQSHILKMQINNMKPGESRLYLIDFDKPN